MIAFLRALVALPFWAVAVVLVAVGAGLDILGHVIAGTWDWQARHPTE